MIDKRNGQYGKVVEPGTVRLSLIWHNIFLQILLKLLKIEI